MATVEQTMMKVQRILTGPMDLKILLDGDSFRISFSESSTAVTIRVRDGGKDPEGESRSLVLVTAPILRGVTPSPEVFEWVARNGGSKWFGHVEAHDDQQEAGKIFLLMSHTLVGDTLDQRELESAVWGVLSAADGWDDELQQQFGGKRWADA